MTRNIFQKLYHGDLQKAYRGFPGKIFDNVIGDIPDLQVYFENLRKRLKPNTKILISYHNPVWEPILGLASYLGLRKKVRLQNWLDQDDLKNILQLSGFEVIYSYLRFFGITTITVAKDGKNMKKDGYSVSIVIPARNEEGNVDKIVPSIPRFGKSQEIIFVEGGSSDKTKQKIEIELKKKHRQGLIVKALEQKGKGKANAVWLGFVKAKGQILMIYDADRTVAASDLLKFYNALAEGLGNFANGSRMIYPMENQAMQTLNKIGNKVFGSLFTWILRQRFKDTLCGTKALFREDYLHMRKFNKKYFKMDPFGDFALIFGAIKNNLKVVEIPVRYKERVYGSTNINRFRHGLMLLKMTFIALKEFRLT